MTKLRIVIVDDEPLARARIRSFLADHPSVELAGEYGDGVKALCAIKRECPDIAFLDVEMPGLRGTELLSQIPPEARPTVVMTTAHDRFAVDAFALEVTDYLVKPFDRERFAAAMRRATVQVRARRAGDLDQRIEGMLSSFLESKPRLLVVKADGRMVFIRPAEVIWVEAENNYCSLHLSGGKRLLLRETLTSLEVRLGPWRFERINRSALVNVDEVLELQPAHHGDYLVQLRNGERLPLSRNLRSRMKDFLGRDS